MITCIDIFKHFPYISNVASGGVSAFGYLFFLLLHLLYWWSSALRALTGFLRLHLFIVYYLFAKWPFCVTYWLDVSLFLFLYLACQVLESPKLSWKSWNPRSRKSDFNTGFLFYLFQLFLKLNVDDKLLKLGENMTWAPVYKFQISSSNPRIFSSYVIPHMALRVLNHVCWSQRGRAAEAETAYERLLGAPYVKSAMLELSKVDRGDDAEAVKLTELFHGRHSGGKYIKFPI